MKKILLLILILVLVIFARVGYSYSFFSDTEKLTGNKIVAGVWSNDTLEKAAGVLGLTRSREIEVHFSKGSDGKAVSFTVSGDDLSKFKNYSYAITYDFEGITQGIVGSGQIKGRSEIVVENLLLGTCTSGGVCLYHTNIKNLNLNLTINDPDTKTFTITLPD